MKPLEYEPSDTNENPPENGGGTEGGGRREGNDSIGVSPVGSQKAKDFKPKGSSITLVGAGRRDGSDVNNSLSLTDFYKYMLENKP